MALLKTILKSDAVRAAGCWIGAQYIRLVYYTGRWEVVGREHADRFWAGDRPFILAFWHGRLLLIPYAWRKGAPVKFLISQHRDGELISRTIAHLGLGSIRGSAARKDKADKNKGGAGALRTMLKEIKAGTSIGITPDGPRGPRMRASMGVAAVAKLTGAPVIPVAYSVSRGQILRSWDRFILAKPFAKGAMVWGAPIEVPRDADDDALEAFRERIERDLTAVTNDADGRVGRPAIEPDPAPDPAPGLAEHGHA